MTPVASEHDEDRVLEQRTPLVNVRAQYTHDQPDNDDEPADATSCDDG